MSLPFDTPWAAPALAAASFAVMLPAEGARPLRRRVEPRGRRLLRNLSIAVPSFAVASLLLTPLAVPVAQWVADQHVGLAQLAPVPTAVRVLLAIVLLDYTLWLWHWANHRVPFLWRFHLVHHVDRDLDASTALRFHFGEMLLTVPYRVLQVVVAGADPLALWLWQALLFVSVVFHHSNVRLPIGLERALVKVIVTPRMHGIHHSDRRNETNSNWSSLLSVWDYLHGTMVLAVPQQEVSIGVPAYRAAQDVTLPSVLALPFVRQREDWATPSGDLSVRSHAKDDRTQLRG
jgi:sterol desaturase/sphingolipid hydroxylase (fatty acid hydroxylase superfamily)